MSKLEVIVKKQKFPCYVCSEIGGIPTKRSKCKCCRGTGYYIDKTYYHIYTDKSGNKMCFSGDTLK